MYIYFCTYKAAGFYGTLHLCVYIFHEIENQSIIRKQTLLIRVKNFWLENRSQTHTGTHTGKQTHTYTYMHIY